MKCNWLCGCKLLTEDDMLGQVGDELSPIDLIRQLSVQLILPLALKQHSVRSGRKTITQHVHIQPAKHYAEEDVGSERKTVLVCGLNNEDQL